MAKVHLGPADLLRPTAARPGDGEVTAEHLGIDVARIAAIARGPPVSIAEVADSPLRVRQRVVGALHDPGVRSLLRGTDGRREAAAIDDVTPRIWCHGFLALSPRPLSPQP